MLRHRIDSHDRSKKRCAVPFLAGQVFMEYTIIIGIVTLVLFAMNTMVKRSLQGMIKTVADQIGSQENSEQRFDESGHLESAITSTRATFNKTIDELVGDIIYIYDDVTLTNGQTVLNMGFTTEN